MSSEKPSYEQLAVLVVEQAATIRRLEGEIVGLRAENVEFRRRLAQNSRNSSRPPSSDGLSKPPVKRSLRRPSGREPGGQPGHRGGHLEMVAIADEIVDHVPAVCAGCRRELAGAEDVGHLVRQVFDLPEIRLRTVEHHAHTLRCVCGAQTTAGFPAGVSAPTQYGPRLRALGIYLVSFQHLPYKRAAALLSDWVGTPVSTGTLAAFIARGAGDLQPFLDEIHEQIRHSPVVHFDETGGRVAGRLRWLFCASTSAQTFFSLHDKRGLDGMDHGGVLPNFSGVAVHDGWAPYRRYEVTHALCNVHHLRELQGIIEQADGDQKQAWAVQMDQLLRELHATVTAAKAAGATRLSPDTLTRYQDRYRTIIKSGQNTNPPCTVRTGKRGYIGQSAAYNLLARLDTYHEDVLRFATDFQVPFDNNQAERDIRMIKLQQKISGCWRTLTGTENFLAIRAYLSTATKQNQTITRVLTQLANRDPWIPAAASP